MLNSFFAFGVPIFLLLIYLGIALFSRKSDIPYLGFVLFIIAGFLSAFSFQVLQQAFTELKNDSTSELAARYGYSPYWLAVPFSMGIILILINLARGYRHFKSSKHKII